MFKSTVRSGLDVLKSGNKKRPKRSSRLGRPANLMPCRAAYVPLVEVLSCLQISSHSRSPSGCQLEAVALTGFCLCHDAARRRICRDRPLRRSPRRTPSSDCRSLHAHATQVQLGPVGANPSGGHDSNAGRAQFSITGPTIHDRRRRGIVPSKVCESMVAGAVVDTRQWGTALVDSSASGR